MAASYPLLLNLGLCVCEIWFVFPSFGWQTCAFLRLLFVIKLLHFITFASQISFSCLGLSDFCHCGWSAAHLACFFFSPACYIVCLVSGHRTAYELAFSCIYYLLLNQGVIFFFFFPLALFLRSYFRNHVFLLSCFLCNFNCHKKFCISLNLLPLSYYFFSESCLAQCFLVCKIAPPYIPPLFPSPVRFFNDLPIVVIWY